MQLRQLVEASVAAAKDELSKKLGPAIIIVSALVGTILYLRETRGAKPLLYGGTLEARAVNVGSLVGGRVIAVHVDDGAQVAAGQPVVTLETDTIDRQIAEQQAAIDAAKASLAKSIAGAREDEIEKAAAVAENDARDLRRMRELYEQGVVSRQAYDAASTKARASAEDVQLLRKGSRREEIDFARAELQRQQRRLETLLEQRSEAVVRSSVSGVVQASALRPGDLVAPNQPVAEILEADQLWVRVYVPETLLGLVRVGQQVKVRVDTFPDTAFRGEVVSISSQGEYTPRNVQTRAQRAEQVFGVKVNVERDPRLKAGMAAEVDFGVKGRA